MKALINKYSILDGATIFTPVFLPGEIQLFGNNKKVYL